jgi:sugar transferase (PEP-CTERM/EpsH1 system associated)
LKILFICHRFPYPPKRGGKIRPFNIIKHLSGQGHDVTVASLVRSNEEAREGEDIQNYCASYIMQRVGSVAATSRMVARLPSSLPSSMGYFYSPRLKARIDAVLGDVSFNLILVHCAFVAQYVDGVHRIPKILDFGDMDSQKWLDYSRTRRFPLSIGYYVEGVKLRRMERIFAKRFDYCTCTTRAELETLESYHAGARTDWFPNGVDSADFHPTEKPYDRDSICFVGRMDYYPNKQAMFFFCAHVLPLLRALRPEIKLLIVGADPSRAVSRLGRLPGVTVTGSVPDVRPFVHQSALTVAPLKIARGTQNKILESMAMGVPVVASDEASRGVDAVPGEHLLTASSPEGYRDAILSLMENPPLRARFSHAGRERVLARHSWWSSLRRLDALIVECMSAHTDRRN